LGLNPISQGATSPIGAENDEGFNTPIPGALKMKNQWDALALAGPRDSGATCDPQTSVKGVRGMPRQARLDTLMHHISAVRAELARILAEEVGISMAECARQIGVTTSGVAQVLRREK